jgi:hypothetical protein
MKPVLAAAAILLLAGCETNRHAAREPASEPRSDDPTAAAGEPSHPLDCPITASKGWSAWIDAMPGPSPRRLVVRGEVVTAGGGYQVAFDPDLPIREMYPAQAVATLHVTSPKRPAASAAVTHEVRWEWPLSQPVGSVTVTCGDKTLAQISKIQTAY